MDGGGIIGTGSYGCVFKPSLPCSSNKSKKQGKGNEVSKIFFGNNSRKESNAEFVNDKIITSIKGHDKWSHVWTKQCKPHAYDKIVTSEKDIHKCLESEGISISDFNDNRYMLKGSDAGSTLTELVEGLFTKSVMGTSKKFITNFLLFMKLLKPLFVGLASMYKIKISHNDIKEDNVMVDEEGCKYIDFGLSSLLKKHKFYEGRSKSEFAWDRVYPPYPYEFFYLHATPELLKDERNDVLHKIYRRGHDRYEDVHTLIFNRTHIFEHILHTLDTLL